MKRSQSRSAGSRGGRIDLATLALEGLSIGDAFGHECFLALAAEGQSPGARRLPSAPWEWTDDTEQATAIYALLSATGALDQDSLARELAARFVARPGAGYAGTATAILTQLARGIPWRDAATSVYGGGGSMGNGAAMRVAPLGAYFADDLDAVVSAALASAEVTHAHPEGRTGAVAVALAAAHLARKRPPADLFPVVLERLPPGELRIAVGVAAALPASAEVAGAARVLGRGERALAADTVPFALWIAAHRLGGFAETLWATAACLGDMDTTCAIVGALLSLRDGARSLPRRWRSARAPLKLGLEHRQVEAR